MSNIKTLSTGFPGLSNYWQNEYHHLDVGSKNQDTRLTFYHAFIRMTSEWLKMKSPKCQLSPLHLVEVNLLQESDHFHGLLVLMKGKVEGKENDVILETHVMPKQYYTMHNSSGPMARLQSMQVSSSF